MLQVGS